MQRFSTLLLASSAFAFTPADWTQLPDLPDPVGVAAPFAGLHNNRLIIAGGANFPDKKPWEGGTKVWHDTIYVLDHPTASWRSLGKLPRPAAYGVSISTSEGLICIGGSDATRHHHQVFRLTFKGDSLQVDDLPPLPQPCANLSGALLDRTIYLCGGIEKPDATAALNTTWSLNLDALHLGWQSLDPLPGPGRILAASGTQDGHFYIVSGAALKPGPDSKPAREWLRDAYRLTPGTGWTRIADSPQIGVAAPTPMPALAPHQLLLLGGDDGTQINTPPTSHPGFPKATFTYHTDTNTWTPSGTLPIALVTTSAILWQNRLVIPGGEIRPGIRSPQIWSLPIPTGQDSSTPPTKNSPP